MSREFIHIDNTGNLYTLLRAKACILFDELSEFIDVRLILELIIFLNFK